MNEIKNFKKQKEEMNRFVEIMLEENIDFYYKEFLPMYDESTDIVIENTYMEKCEENIYIKIENISWLIEKEVKEIYYINSEYVNLMLCDGQHLEIRIL